MTLGTWIGILLWIPVVLMAGLSWLMQKHHQETAALLLEIHQCNAEFAEAVALLRYGAVDEAIEMSQRWQERAKA